MGKQKFKYVFVVLVYRNTQDLKDFFQAFGVKDSKVIVVNSFYDDVSKEEFRIIAEQNNADFISVPNLGYGYGNNRGCEFALKHYLFNWLIISNADIIIKKFPEDVLNNHKNDIVAPNIINLKGKRQNPSSAFARPWWLDTLQYKVYKAERKRLIYVFYALSRLQKSFFYLISPLRKRIFAAHGAFVIIPFSVIQKLFPIYNEEMFLFAEEIHFGRLASQNGVKTYYEPEIEISHKEDGSVSLAVDNVYKPMRQSFMVYYEYWKKQIK